MLYFTGLILQKASAADPFQQHLYTEHDPEADVMLRFTIFAGHASP